MPVRRMHRRLGLSQSRLLWEATRQRQGKSVLQQALDLIKAISYEVQPVRFNQLGYGDALRSVKKAFAGLVYFVTSTLPYISIVLFNTVKSLSKFQWLCVAGVLAYYYALKWIHQVLSAGPIVLMSTILYVLWTFGLSDDNDDNGLSAYAVFNRGYERLLGSIDADALLAQYVGLPMGGGGGGRFDNNNNINNARHRQDDNNNDNDIARDNNNTRNRKSGKRKRRNFERRQQVRLEQALGIHEQGIENDNHNDVIVEDDL